jgi:DNA-directed RNA polymerase subunit RPC12/RpoP
MSEEFEPWWRCPECGNRNFKIEYGLTDGYKCKECGHRGIVPYPNM